MLSRKGYAKRLSVVLPLGLGTLVFVLVSILLNTGTPVRAQDPPDEGFDPKLMAIDPRPLADNELPIRVSVNYAHDIIEESYPAGYTVWLTVTTATGDVKATTELVSGNLPWWEAWRTGFSSEAGTWVPVKPDIVPGDWVYASSSAGHSTEMQVGRITAETDKVEDVITGIVDAPWLLEPSDYNDDNFVEVKCKAYYIADPTVYNQAFEDDDPDLRKTTPDGEDLYDCDFGREGWQLTPGQLLAISYDPLEPYTRSNRTINVFAVPGPHLQIKTSAPGSPGIATSGGTVRPGNLVRTIEYRNVGTEDATGVVITDVFSGMTYLGDTSGHPHSDDSTGTQTWQVGLVPAGAHVQFQVFARVTANPGEAVSDSISITSNPAENGGLDTERRDTWSSTVWANGAYLSINKNSWTPSPSPGSEFVHVDTVCNTDYRYAVDSSRTTLIENLAPGLTLLEWWSEDGGWSEVSRSSSQLTIRRESVAAHGCTDVYLRVRLDAGAQPGDEVCTTAQVLADNNYTVDPSQITYCQDVSAPQANLAVAKTWSGGTLVPGGDLVYQIEVHNTGNTRLTGSILVTDTIPASTTFVDAELDPDSPVSFDVNPVTQTGDRVVWEISEMEPGTWARFSVELRLDDAVSAGTEIVNTVEVGLPTLTEDLNDNVATWTETVQASGPNLRVIKTADWGNRGPRPGWLDYRVMVQNVGDTGVYDVVATDIYDDEMTWTGAIQFDWWEDVYFTRNDTAKTFTAGIEYLPPGEQFAIDFATSAGTPPVAPGLTFVNTATASPGHMDTAPGDNTATVTSASGPDLALTKAYAGGAMEAGQEVTYLLTYRNTLPADSWWWSLQGDAIVTDVLPDGLEFVSAEQWRCGAETWCAAPPTSVNGQTVTWNVGSIAPGEVNALRVRTRIQSTVPDQTQLTNDASIASTDPANDAEANTENNASAATITVTGSGAASPYTLDVTINGQGTVARMPDQDTYGDGDVVTLTATPAAGWRFAGWTGDITSAENPLEVEMTGDLAVTANFESDGYTLLVTIYGEGRVDKMPEQETYAYGDEVVLVATPDPGWLFTGWTGAVTGSASRVTLTITANIEVTATFTEFGLTATKAVAPDADVMPGSVVTYTITLTNTSMMDLGVALTDTLPSDLTFGEITGATTITPLPDVTGNTLTWSGMLPADMPSAVIVFTATVGTGDGPYLETITNRVDFSTLDGQGAAEATLTTAARSTLYLPIVFRTFTP